MALTVVQSKTGATTSIAATTVAATWSQDTTTGNLIVVGVAAGTQHVSSITDSQGNTYVAADTGAFAWSTCEIWYAKNITGGSLPTVTVTLAGGEPATIHLYEVSGANAAAPLDVHSNASGDGVTATTIAAVSGSTTEADQIVFSLGAIYLATGTDDLSVGAGYDYFTGTNSTPTTGITVTSGMQAKIVSVVGPQIAAFGQAFPQSTWEAAIATFKQAIATPSTNPATVSGTDAEVTLNNPATTATIESEDDDATLNNPPVSGTIG